MEFRHEVKHEISPQDVPALRQRLRADRKSTRLNSSHL